MKFFEKIEDRRDGSFVLREVEIIRIFDWRCELCDCMGVDVKYVDDGSLETLHDFQIRNEFGKHADLSDFDIEYPFNDDDDVEGDEDDDVDPYDDYYDYE